MTHLADISTGANLTAEFNLRFAIRVERERYQAMPPRLQAETLSRVMANVERHPNSWLAKHWKQIYGGTIR
jgi:hypothetical protein